MDVDCDVIGGPRTTRGTLMYAKLHKDGTKNAFARPMIYVRGLNIMKLTKSSVTSLQLRDLFDDLSFSR